MNAGLGGLLGSGDLTSLSSMKIPLSSLSSSSPLLKKEWISCPTTADYSVRSSNVQSWKSSSVEMSLRKRFALTLLGWRIFRSLIRKAHSFCTNRF